MASSTKRAAMEMANLDTSSQVLASCAGVLGNLRDKLGAADQQRLKLGVSALSGCSEAASKGSVALGGGSRILAKSVCRRMRVQEQRESVGKKESVSMHRENRTSTNAMATISSFVGEKRSLSAGTGEQQKSKRRKNNGGKSALPRTILAELKKGSFSALEAVRLLKKTRDDDRQNSSKNLRRLGEHLIEHDLVPVSGVRALNKRLKIYTEQGTPNVKEWGDRGQPRTASKSDLDVICEKYNVTEGGGGTISLKQLKTEMTELGKQKRLERGQSLIGYNGPCDETIKVAYEEIKLRKETGEFHLAAFLSAFRLCRRLTCLHRLHSPAP